MRKISKSKRAPLAAVPPIRWVGGKRVIADWIMSHVRPGFSRIVVPFFGGGGDSSCFAARYPGVELLASDALPDTVDMFLNMDDHIFIGHVRAYEAKYVSLKKSNRQATRDARKQFFYPVRDSYDDLLPGPFKRATLFFLLRVCFSGLFRRSKKGKLNTPAGYMINKSIGGIEHCEPWAAFVRSVQLAQMDFRDAIASRVTKGTFLYLDPPYKDTFDGYCGWGFPQEELAPACRLAMDLGARQILMSQSADPDYWREQFDRVGLPIKIRETVRGENVKAKSGKGMERRVEHLIEVVS